MLAVAPLIGLAALAACSDNSTPAAAPPAASQAPKSAPASTVDITALKSELANATPADIQVKAEDLWKSGNHAAAVEIAQLSYDRDKNAAAAYRLGTAYFGGNGVTKDLGKAWDYFSLPSLDGDRYSLYYSGMILADPAYDKRDIAAARTALQRAKELGVAEAGAALAALPPN